MFRGNPPRLIARQTILLLSDAPAGRISPLREMIPARDRLRSMSFAIAIATANFVAGNVRCVRCVVVRQIDNRERARRCHSLIAGGVEAARSQVWLEGSLHQGGAVQGATSELSGDRARKRAFRALAFILILRMALGLGR